MTKRYRLDASEIRPLVSGHGYCMASDHITVEGRRVGFMYRHQPDTAGDSGWVFLSGLESQDYLDESTNLALYDVNTIANYDPTIIPYLTHPVGSAYGRGPDELEFQLEPMPDHLDDMPNDLIAGLEMAFETDFSKTPAITLRSGDSIDSYGAAIPFDAEIDVVSNDYITKYCWGVAHLDAESWRHYLPALGSFAIHHLSTNNPAVEALIASLRPPDREPPRLGSLNSVQERLICQLLEVLAYSAESVWQAEACQALEEWWIDGALYRP